MITPCSVSAFLEALNGKRGEFDAWLECYNETEVCEHIRLALAQERERCAQVCDTYADYDHANFADRCAEDIREWRNPNETTNLRCIWSDARAVQTACHMGDGRMRDFPVGVSATTKVDRG